AVSRHQALASAGRAGVPVRFLGSAAVERLDRALGSHRHLVNRAVAEIDELLGLADRELRSETVAGVARVGGRRSVAALHRVGHLRIAELPRPDAIADADELAVPAIRRKPDFDLDVG